MKHQKRLKKQDKRLKSLYQTFFMIVAGAIIFKFVPMFIWSKDILWDASMHIMSASFGLYLFYHVIEHSKPLRFPYILFSIIALVSIGLQRLIAMQHNLIGVILGLIISFIAIYLPRFKLNPKSNF